MCTRGERLGKGVFALFSRHQFGQARAVHRALVGQLLGQGDGLSVVVERHKHSHVFFGAANTEVHAVHQAVEHVGEVQFAVDQLVTHAGPAGFLAGDDLDAIFLVKAQDGRHYYAGAVGERNEADLDFGFLWCIRAAGIHRSA